MLRLRSHPSRPVRVPSLLLAWVAWVAGEVLRATGSLLRIAGWVGAPWIQRAAHPASSRTRWVVLMLPHLGRTMETFPVEAVVSDILRGHAALMVWTRETRLHPGHAKLGNALPEPGGTLMEEKRKILEMVARGQISPDEGVKLLEALETPKTPHGHTRKKVRTLLIEVHDLEDDEHVVVRLPLSLLRWGIKAGVSFKALAAAKVQDPEVRAQVERAFEALNELDVDHLLQEAQDLGDLVRVDSEEARVSIRIE